MKPISRDAWLTAADEACRVRKQHILAERYSDAVATTANSTVAQAALAEFVGRGEELYPDEIANVATAVADDLCLLDVDDEQRLVAACVCSPSYWRLADKIGSPLWDIHGPVQGMNEKIGGSIERFIGRAPHLQPFERRNWFIHRDREPFHLDPEGDIGADVAAWFVRSERQTLCRIENHLLFTIHVQCEALKRIRQFPIALNGLIASLRAMDDGEIAHFGGVAKHGRLLDRLGRWSGK